MGWGYPLQHNVQTFDGRDQVIRSRTYSGDVTSATYQDETASYDGHGRIKTAHDPIEDAQTETTWIYNSDDSIQQLIDPRGVITSYIYNSRGLTEHVNYSVPNGSTVLGAQSVDIDYDNLGNRTQMTDRSGTKTYSYDSLSRLTSETQSFSGLPWGNSYSLTYTYELSGQLKSLTDAFGTVTSYSLDRLGRVSSVNGSGPLSLPQYISSVGRRAWGGTKQINYGNGRSLNLSYNNRLQVSRIEMPGVGSGNYSYYADGNVKFFENDNEWPGDYLGNTADRSRFFQYDHVGRLIHGETGSYARDKANNLQIGTTTPIRPGPFTKTMSY